METIKIVILGASNVGKLSVATSYFNLEWATKLDDIGHQKFDGKFTLQNGTQIKIILNVLYDRLPSAILNARKMADGAILLFDLTNKDSFKIITDYLEKLNITHNDLQEFALAILGNKCEDEAKYQISNEVVQQFANPIGIPYFRVSAEKKIGIEEAIRNIVEAAYANRHPNQVPNQVPNQAPNQNP